MYIFHKYKHFSSFLAGNYVSNSSLKGLKIETNIIQQDKGLSHKGLSHNHTDLLYTMLEMNDQIIRFSGIA